MGNLGDENHIGYSGLEIGDMYDSHRVGNWSDEREDAPEVNIRGTGYVTLGVTR